MKKYSKNQYVINGVCFNIFGNIGDNIRDYFNESVVKDFSLIESEYNFYLYEESSMYLEKLKNFKKEIAKKYDTFNNQIHFQDGNTFMIDNGEYLCEVIDNCNFKVYSGNS